LVRQGVAGIVRVGVDRLVKARQLGMGMVSYGEVRNGSKGGAGFGASVTANSARR
jgi:hypothetical protein